MALARWPYDDLFRLFSTLTPPAARESAGVFPPVNLYDDGTSFMVRTEIPGVDKDSIEVTAAGDQLTIRGERVVLPAGPEASYHRRECDGGQFRRTVTLPQPVDAEAIKASFKQGVLEVLLPRVPEKKPRKIAVA
ncbi:MAG: Hsp20/alpha crystallin family protein [Myxococcaceae bacterium]